MSVKTEILLEEKLSKGQEAKQSDIKTRVYDREAQFYQYGETVTQEVKSKTGLRQNAFLTISLVLLGGVSLFGAVAVAAIYGLSDQIFRTGAINQVDVREVKENESGDKPESGAEPSAFGPEKAVRPNIPEDKKSSEMPVRKENPATSETRSEKVIEQDTKTRPQSSDESPQSVADNTLSNPAKSTPQPAPEETKREFWKNPPQTNNYQNLQNPPRNWREAERPETQYEFPPLKNRRREVLIEKFKQLRPDQRSRIRGILRKQRGKG